MKRLLATVPLFAVVATALPADADDLAAAAFGFAPSGASVLSDAALAGMRGKFVVGGTPVVLASPPAALTLPGLTPPSTGAPSFTAPTITAPSITAPSVTVPPISGASIVAPTITAPAVTAPTVTPPMVTAPTVTTPTVTAPGAPTPPDASTPPTALTVTAPSITAATIPSTTSNVVAAGPANTALAQPSAGITGAGADVVYFGLNLTTTWSAKATDGTTTTYSAGALFGVDLSGGTPSLTVQTSSGKDGSGTPIVGSVTNSTTGSIADGRVNGVAQAIQAAGNGNSIANTANVDISTVRPNFVVAPGGSTPCGSACSISAAAGALGLKVQLPGGAVGQGIGSGGLYQTAQVTSSFNDIANKLGLHVQVSNPTLHSITPPGFSYTVLRPPSLLGGH